MKQHFATLLAILLVASFFLPTHASAATNPGIKPGSIFYFFDTTLEQIDLFFTFNPEKKAKKALRHAEERLAEAGAVTDNAEAVKTAITHYESSVAIAAERSKDTEKEKAEALFTTIADTTSKHQEILVSVLDQVPDEAKAAITRAIEANQKSQEEALQKIEELKREINELKEELQELKGELEAREGVPETDKQKTIIQELRDENSKDEAENTKTQTQKREEEIQRPEIKTPEIEAQETNTKTETPADSSQDSETQERKEFVRLEFTSPDGTFTNERIFFNPAINKQQIDDLVDAGWKIVDSFLSQPITFGRKKGSNEETESVKNVNDKYLQITKVNVIPALTTANIEWETNKPAQSKIFLSGGTLSSKVFSSESGLSTRHILNIKDLTSNTEYIYELESITGDEVIKKQGVFTTKPQTFTAEPTKSPTNSNDTAPFLKLTSNRPFTINKLVFLNDDSYCLNGEYVAINLTLQYKTDFRIRKNPAGRFIFDYTDSSPALTHKVIISEINENGLHVPNNEIVFRLSTGAGRPSETDVVVSENVCTKEDWDGPSNEFPSGFKYTLHGSESIVFNEKGEKISVPSIVLDRK